MRIHDCLPFYPSKIYLIIFKTKKENYEINDTFILYLYSLYPTNWLIDAQQKTKKQNTKKQKQKQKIENHGPNVVFFFPFHRIILINSLAAFVVAPCVMLCVRARVVERQHKTFAILISLLSLFLSFLQQNFSLGFYPFSYT